VSLGLRRVVYQYRNVMLNSMKITSPLTLTLPPKRGEGQGEGGDI
jgi:hypothetical protein